MTKSGFPDLNSGVNARLVEYGEHGVVSEESLPIGVSHLETVSGEAGITRHQIVSVSNLDALKRAERDGIKGHLEEVTPLDEGKGNDKGWYQVSLERER